MFKEITEDLIALLTPSVETPACFNKVPNELLVQFSLIEKFEPDKSLYNRYIVSKNEDIIYLTYGGEMDSSVFYDIVYYKGKRTAVIIVNDNVYDLMKDEDTDMESLFGVICTISLTVDLALRHLDVPYGNKMPKFSKTCHVVERLAPIIISCAVIMNRVSVYDSDMPSISKVINNIFGTSLEPSALQVMIDDLKQVGVGDLLDNSYVVGEIDFIVNSKSEENSNDGSISED